MIREMIRLEKPKAIFDFDSASSHSFSILSKISISQAIDNDLEKLGGTAFERGAGSIRLQTSQFGIQYRILLSKRDSASYGSVPGPIIPTERTTK